MTVNNNLISTDQFKEANALILDNSKGSKKLRLVLEGNQSEKTKIAACYTLVGLVLFIDRVLSLFCIKRKWVELDVVSANNSKIKVTVLLNIESLCKRTVGFNRKDLLKLTSTELSEKLAKLNQVAKSIERSTQILPTSERASKSVESGKSPPLVSSDSEEETTTPVISRSSSLVRSPSISKASIDKPYTSLSRSPSASLNERRENLSKENSVNSAGEEICREEDEGSCSDSDTENEHSKSESSSERSVTQVKTYSHTEIQEDRDANDRFLEERAVEQNEINNSESESKQNTSSEIGPKSILRKDLYLYEILPLSWLESGVIVKFNDVKGNKKTLLGDTAFDNLIENPKKPYRINYIGEARYYDRTAVKDRSAWSSAEIAAEDEIDAKEELALDKLEKIKAKRKEPTEAEKKDQDKWQNHLRETYASGDQERIAELERLIALMS